MKFRPYFSACVRRSLMFSLVACAAHIAHGAAPSFNAGDWVRLNRSETLLFKGQNFMPAPKGQEFSVLKNDAAQQQVLAAAREGSEAVLSYSSENLDASLADAKSHLTGEFLDQYSKFTDDVVRPAVTQKGVKTEAHVARAAVSEMHPDTAQVLVFVNQVTTSKDRPSPALATSSVMVTMVRSGGQWLISEFKPI
jgi:Mce-associated membrane protein